MGKTYYAGKELFRKHRQMDGTTPGSPIGLHAIRTRCHRILQTKREVQIRESYAKVL